MNGNPKIIETLNGLLVDELTAIHQFSKMKRGTSIGLSRRITRSDRWVFRIISPINLYNQ